MKSAKQTKYVFAIEIFLFVALLYGTTVSVYLNGDDFMYGTFAHSGILKNTWLYYLTGNGRFWINILDSALLRFDRYAFIVVAPWIILCFVWLFSKNLQLILKCESNENNTREFMRYGMALFACLDVLCLRETVFWITGMMNYLFPATVLLFAYYLFRLSRLRKLTKAYIIVYYVICFLASSSVEQYALMFVGLMTLHHGWDLLNKHRIPLYEWIAYGIAIVGVSVLVLAPGNFERVSAGQAVWSLYDNVWALIANNTIQDPAFPYIIMLCICSIFLKKKKGLKVAHLWSIPVLAIFVLYVFRIERAIIWSIIIALMFYLIISIFWNSPREVQRDMLFWTIVGIGSQVMLMISIVWGFRCMLSTYLVYMILLGILISTFDSEEKTFILCSGIFTAINPMLTLLFWGMNFIFYLKKKELLRLKTQQVLLRTGIVTALLILCVGYRANVSTYQENLQSTKLKNDSVTIKELPNKVYSWYSVPFNEFHDQYYRAYHGLGDVEVLYHMED